MSETTLTIKNLHVSLAGDAKEILHGVSLAVKKGEVHAIMGPNGSGKSTLASVIFGHPNYEVTKGSVALGNSDITTLSPDKRANLGLFIAFQNPQSVPGVKINSFIKQAVNAKRRFAEPKYSGMKIREYRELLQGTMKKLAMKPEFAERYLNEGFSGGEKKKAEILQLAMLNPEIAILDEIDSGLDVDALRVVCDGVNALRRDTGLGVLLITHYPRILKFIEPDQVHIMLDGKIVESGDAALAHKIEAEGYDWLRV
jgi:Fe-S cluster assembly ATP-binding protein